MSALKNSLILIFVLAFFASDDARVWAQPDLFTTVTSEKVSLLESLHQQATDLLLKNEFQAAIRVYSDILLVEPDDETAYTALGQIYLVLGQFKKAHDSFRNALHINPDNQVAAAGIQQIMDPDGVEGMITPAQAQAEGLLSPLTPNFKASAKMDARSSAGRAVKSAAIPVRHPAKLRASSRSGRPGFMNAQRIQMALKNSGFYSGAVNGLIGGSTKKAVSSFQKKKNLPATGRVSQETWRLLSAELPY